MLPRSASDGEKDAIKIMLHPKLQSLHHKKVPLRNKNTLDFSHIDLKAKSNDGKTGFMLVCKNGHTYVVKLVLDQDDILKLKKKHLLDSKLGTKQ